MLSFQTHKLGWAQFSKTVCVFLRFKAVRQLVHQFIKYRFRPWDNWIRWSCPQKLFHTLHRFQSWRVGLGLYRWNGSSATGNGYVINPSVKAPCKDLSSPKSIACINWNGIKRGNFVVLCRADSCKSLIALSSLYNHIANRWKSSKLTHKNRSKITPQMTGLELATLCAFLPPLQSTHTPEGIVLIYPQWTTDPLLFSYILCVCALVLRSGYYVFECTWWTSVIKWHGKT